MNFNNFYWSYVMDWVVFGTCAALLLTVIFDIFKSVKNTKNLSGEHNILKENQKDGQSRLENEHKHIEFTIQNEHQNTNHIIEKETSQIYSIVNNVDRKLVGEIERNNMQHNNLTEHQLDIKQSVKAINDLMKEVEKLQSLSVVQNNEISALKSEIKKLSEFNKELLSYKQQLLSDNRDLKQENNRLIKEISILEKKLEKTENQEFTQHNNFTPKMHL